MYQPPLVVTVKIKWYDRLMFYHGIFPIRLSDFYFLCVVCLAHWKFYFDFKDVSANSFYPQGLKRLIKTRLDSNDLIKTQWEHRLFIILLNCLSYCKHLAICSTCCYKFNKKNYLQMKDKLYRKEKQKSNKNVK